VVSPTFAALLALALFSALPAAAESSTIPACEAGVRHIELAADAVGHVLEVCIRPGLSTNLFFDSKLARVELERRERFRRVVEGVDTLTLVPAEALTDGERITVTVQFGDGAAPTSAMLVLVVHPAQAERQVEVFRHPRTVASYRQEAQEARAEARRCQREKAHLQAECGGRVGLTGLIAHGLMDQWGIPSRDLSREAVRHPGDTLNPTKVISYRAATRPKEGMTSVLRLAVEVWLVNEGVTSWKPAGAVLVGSTGEALKVLEVWPSKPIAPGEVGTVVVEVEATEREARGSFTLKSWAEEGAAGGLTLGGVTFP
jgi:uncharacterized protein (TIGR02268 family)